MDGEHLGLLQPWMWMPIGQKVLIDWTYTAQYNVQCPLPYTKYTDPHEEIAEQKSRTENKMAA